MKLYSYGACSTCRKALAWLRQQALSVDPIDITQQPPSPDELAQALQQLGRKRLLNTSGQSYRALGKDTVAAMGDDQLIAALAADGRLIKRPFLISDQGKVVTGFNPDEWQALVG